MKTKEQWIQTDNIALRVHLQAMVEEIQKDALIHAAQICHEQKNNACDCGFASQFDCEYAIRDFIKSNFN